MEERCSLPANSFSPVCIREEKGSIVRSLNDICQQRKRRADRKETIKACSTVAEEDEP